MFEWDAYMDLKLVVEVQNGGLGMIRERGKSGKGMK
jgi:hypothetical protein